MIASRSIYRARGERKCAKLTNYATDKRKHLFLFIYESKLFFLSVK